MELFSALAEMRRLSAQKIPFSFSFVSYNSTKGVSNGVVAVARARLGKRERKEYHRHADIVESYINLDTGEQKRFYQPLLLTFNGTDVELKYETEITKNRQR